MNASFIHTHWYSAQVYVVFYVYLAIEGDFEAIYHVGEEEAAVRGRIESPNHKDVVLLGDVDDIEHTFLAYLSNGIQQTYIDLLG